MGFTLWLIVTTDELRFGAEEVRLPPGRWRKIWRRVRVQPRVAAELKGELG